MARQRKFLTWDFELSQRPATLALSARVAGVDEAGRGCLAGPVHAAAIVLPTGFQHPHLRDSKLLPGEDRAELAHHLRTHPDVLWAVGTATPAEIDQHNILQATLLAMTRAVHALSAQPDYVLIDGNACPKQLLVPLRTLIDGDALCPSIAAASVLAKTSRDETMVSLSALYPAYGFAQHKGYATPEHQHALNLHGPCPIHRHSFRPVRIAAGAKTGDYGPDWCLR